MRQGRGEACLSTKPANRTTENSSGVIARAVRKSATRRTAISSNGPDLMEADRTPTFELTLDPSEVIPSVSTSRAQTAGSRDEQGQSEHSGEPARTAISDIIDGNDESLPASFQSLPPLITPTAYRNLKEMLAESNPPLPDYSSLPDTEAPSPLASPSRSIPRELPTVTNNAHREDVVLNSVQLADDEELRQSFNELNHQAEDEDEQATMPAPARLHKNDTFGPYTTKPSNQIFAQCPLPGPAASQLLSAEALRGFVQSPQTIPGLSNDMYEAQIHFEPRIVFVPRVQASDGSMAHKQQKRPRPFPGSPPAQHVNKQRRFPVADLTEYLSDKNGQQKSIAPKANMVAAPVADRPVTDPGILEASGTQRTRSGLEIAKGRKKACDDCRKRRKRCYPSHLI